MGKTEYTEITQQDLDILVEMSDKDPHFKSVLQQLDQLANKRGIELRSVIETAISLYHTNKTVKEWNENRGQTVQKT